MRNCCDLNGVHARPGVFSFDRCDNPACVRFHHVSGSRGNPSACAYNRLGLHSDTPTYSVAPSNSLTRFHTDAPQQ